MAPRRQLRNAVEWQAAGPGARRECRAEFGSRWTSANRIVKPIASVLDAAPTRLIMTPTLAFLSMLLLSLSQGRWQEIGKTRTGNPVYIDPKSVKKADGIVSATIRVTFATPVTVPTGKLSASRAMAMFDCAKRTVAAKENTLYFDERTNAVYERKVNAKPGFGPAIAGTFADVAIKHFCDAK